MLNVFRPLSGRRAAFGFLSFFVAVGVQAQVPVTLLQQQLHRVEIGVSGEGEITSTVNGKNYLNTAVTQRESKTVGALINVRYTKSPLLGLEFNYGIARFTQHFTFVDSTGTPQPVLVGGAQNNATEYTVGYLAHTPRIFGVQPFVSVGAGATSFKGTANGGQFLPEQARMTYYYSAGVEQSLFSSHFGLRAQFRQAFFLAPDFGQNYLTIKQRQISTEPAIGFYIHF